MVKLLKYMEKKQWGYSLCVLVFVVISVWCTLTMPDYMTKITTLVQTGGDINEILGAGAIMLAFALGDGICTVIVGFFTSRIAGSFSAKLRREIYGKVVGFSMKDINSFSTASLVTRSTNDITQVTMVIAIGLQMMLRAPIVAIWAVFKIAGKGWQWSLITAIAVAVLILTLVVIMSLAIPKFKLVQKLTDKINRITRENLTGVRVVRAYNAEEYQENKFEGANKEITGNYLFTGKVMSFLNPMMQAIMSGTSLAIYWVGAYMISNAPGASEKIAIFSNLVVFMAYAIQMILAFMMIAMIFVFLPRAEVSAARIQEVLDVTNEIHDGKGVNPAGIKGKVEFKDVTFRYPDAEEPVLEHISFTADPGEVVAFIGSTGSGKSTLINLVPRFYDVTEGAVLVDGEDVRNYRQKDLHAKMGYVSQKAVLFKGTIASNVDYGEDTDGTRNEEDIIRAMEIAQGKDIIDGEEKGIYAEVAQGGTNFSGGQKQRISIARAICRRPEIYIFDDSFSALDYKTDKILRAGLRKEIQGATSLIVAQRIGTVMDADKIIVLDEGKMAGIGTHEELLANCEVYRQIALSQLSKEELA